MPRSWITLYPTYYRQERARMQRHYPEFRLSDIELAQGCLAYSGEITVDIGEEYKVYPVLLIYSSETPYRAPSLSPLRSVPDTGEWQTEELLKPDKLFRMPVGYRRHQMSLKNGGSLCLVEPEENDQISGVAMLRRAAEVFRAVEAGQPYPFPDSEQVELEAHFDVAGDILIGAAFLDEELSGSGGFYATLHPDFDPRLPAYVPQSARQRALFVALHITSVSSVSGVIETDWRNAASEPLVRAFPKLADPRFTFEGSSFAPEISEIVFEGRWWDLPAEPEPVRSGRELEGLLELAGVEDTGYEMQRLALAARDDGAVQLNLALLGFRYPSRENGREWLFLALKIDETPPRNILEAEGESAWRDVGRSGQVLALRCHTLTRPVLELRNRDQVSEDLSEKKVLLIGCGALGGTVADLLAKAGVGQLIQVDPDIVRIGNVIRHVASVQSVGLAKPDAVRHVVHRHNPFVEVESIPGSATNSLDRLEELLASADVVVCTIANENTEMVINETAVRLQQPVIYARALRAGSAARVFRVRPGEDACKQCYALYRQDYQSNHPNNQSDWIDVPPLEGEEIGRECGNPILAGSAADLTFAASFATRATLDELSGESEWNSLVWSREPIPDVHEAFGEPFATRCQLVRPHPDCPTCARPRTRSLVIAASAYEAIVENAEANPDAETGGVLIGFCDRNEEQVAVVLEATDAGPEAVETRERFERDADYVQSKLEDAAARLGLNGDYLGEWHSHLEANPQPSARDVESLTGISETPSYLTNEPLIIIAGLNPDSGKVEGLHASCFPLNRRFLALEWKIESDDQALARSSARR